MWIKMYLLLVLNIMWIFTNVIESSKNETAPEVLFGIIEGNENITREDIFGENRTNLITLGHDGNLSSNKDSDSCFNNRGYPSLKTCITDCERKDTEYSQCVYNMGMMTHKVLHLKRGEYTIDDDDNIHITAWNVTKTSEHYRMYDDETLIVCLPLFVELLTCPEGKIAPARVEFRDNEHKIWIRLFHAEFDWNEFFYYKGLLIFCYPREAFAYKTIVKIHLAGALISTASLCLILLLSVFIPILRKNPSLLCHMLMLALAFGTECCFLIMNKNKSPVFCITVNALYHFFILSSFLWMNFHAFELFLMIRSIKPRKLRILRFLFYSLISWGIPLILLAVSVIAELKEIPNMMPGYKLHCGLEYGSGLAFAYFYGWVALSVLINIIFFVLIIWSFWTVTKKSTSDSRKFQKNLILLTVQLIVIMGILWLFEILIWAEVGNTLVLSWFSVITSFQGLFVVLVYICQEQVFKNIITKLKSPCVKKEETMEMKTQISDSNRYSTLISSTIIDNK